MGNCESCNDKKNTRKNAISMARISGSNPLLIRSIDDLHANNSLEHATASYEFVEQKPKKVKRSTDQTFAPVSPLVLRRGIPFDLRINFAREFRKGEDLVNLVFTLEDAQQPSYAEHTQVIVPVNDENMNTIALSELNGGSHAWHAVITKMQQHSIQVEVTSSPNALIGIYRLQIDSKSSSSFSDDSKFSFVSYQVDTRLYLLFNAWIKKDPVYLRGKEEREEYVNNENGIIWRGTWKSPTATPWGYSQYSEGILDTVMYVLRSLNPSSRGDPLAVARHLSAVVNDANGHGILKGNWDEKFNGGRAPASWQNSKEILLEYFKHKKAARFGQCWNFAGVLCTCLRSLGIASRVVTCYMAAHDTHGSLTVDRVMNENLEHLKEQSRDSVWNFHTWVEFWCKRNDLDPYGRYDGWQVVDSTPQEKSDNIYRCGPTSIIAVRTGSIQQPFDTKFVFAEVNADEVFWLYKGANHPLKLIQTNTEEIGKLIVTKKIGRNDYENITSAYKEMEGSHAERETMLRALKMSASSFARFYLNVHFTDVSFELRAPNDVLVGQPLEAVLVVNNKSSRIYNLDCVFAIQTGTYTNRSQIVVKKLSSQKKLSPLSIEEIPVLIEYNQYSKYLMGENTFSISALTNVLEINFSHIEKTDLRVRMPKIDVQVDGDPIRGRPIYCRATFINPLPHKLSSGTFSVDGPGLVKPLLIKTKSFNVDEEVSCNFTLVPNSIGDKVISIKFSNNQLKNIESFRNIRVTPNMNDISLTNDSDLY